MEGRRIPAARSTAIVDLREIEINMQKMDLADEAGKIREEIERMKRKLEALKAAGVIEKEIENKLKLAEEELDKGTKESIEKAKIPMGEIRNSMTGITGYQQAILDSISTKKQEQKGCKCCCCTCTVQ